MSNGYGTVNPGPMNDLNAALANMAVMFDEAAVRKDNEAARIRATAQAAIDTAIELEGRLNFATVQMKADRAWDAAWYRSVVARLGGEVPEKPESAVDMIRSYADATAGQIEAEAAEDRARAILARQGFLVVDKKDVASPSWLHQNNEIYRLAMQQGRVRFGTQVATG